MLRTLLTFLLKLKEIKELIQKPIPFSNRFNF